MAIKPEDLLDMASALEDGDSETDWRTAVNRGYYAAFHCCTDVVRNARLPLGAGGVHAALVDALTGSLNPATLKSLGYMLDQCRRHRVTADYRIDEDFPHDLAQATVADSRRILEKAKTL